MLFKLKSRGFFISNNISTPRRLFCNNHENKHFIILPRQQNREMENEVTQSVTSYLNKTSEKAVPCCTLVILGMQTIGFVFERE